MRCCFTGLLCLAALSIQLNAQSITAAVSETPAVNQTEKHPDKPKKKDVKAAAKVFRKGVDAVKHEDLESALKYFTEAASLDPAKREYSDSEELTRQQLVKKLLVHADEQLVAKDRAAAETLAKIERLDPQNPMLLERLHQLAVSQAPPHISHDEAYADTEIKLLAKAGTLPFKVRGDTRSAYEQMAHAFGLVVVFDASLPSKQIRMDVDQISFDRLSEFLERVTNTFIVPVTSKQFIVAADNPENRKQYERLWVETFYLHEPSTPAELNDIANLLRNLFQVRSLSVDPASGTMVVKAPRHILDGFSDVVDAVCAGEPEVSLQLQIIDVDNSYTKQLGTSLPLQFTLFNVATEERNLLGSTDLSQLSGLLNSGSLTQAAGAALGALLAQGQGGGAASSLLQQPIAVFGGGLTQSGVEVPPATLTANYAQSWLRSLQTATILAVQGKESTFRAGSRYPIVNSLFSAVSVPTVGNNGSAPALSTSITPSFTYEDLGITLKATPTIHSSSDVTLKLSLQIRSLGSETVNNIPVIENQQYEGTVTLRAGETAVLAGALTKSDIRTISGIPLLSLLPGLGTAASQQGKQTEEDGLLLVITPTIVRGSFPRSAEVWLPPEK